VIKVMAILTWFIGCQNVSHMSKTTKRKLNNNKNKRESSQMAQSAGT
jgi:hypothetical protein